MDNKKNNTKTNVLKKIEVGNPLYNLGLYKLLDEHNATSTDEGLAKFYHRLLGCVEGSEVATKMTYAMIAFSTGMDADPLYLEAMGIIASGNAS